MHPDHISLLTTGLYLSLPLCHDFNPLVFSHQVTTCPFSTSKHDSIRKSTNNFIVLLPVTTGLLLYFRKPKSEIHLSLPQPLLSRRPLTSSKQSGRDPSPASIDLYTKHHVMMLWLFLLSSQAVDSYFHNPCWKDLGVRSFDFLLARHGIWYTTLPKRPLL